MDLISAYFYRRKPIDDPDFVEKARHVFQTAGGLATGAYPLPGADEALAANDLAALHGAVEMRIPFLEQASGMRVRMWSFRSHGVHGGTAVFSAAVALPGYNAGGAQTAWQFALNTLPAVVEAFDPDLLVVNGVHPGVQAFPGWEALPADGTVVFGPATYMPRRQMGSTWEQQLAMLPAFRTEPFGDGWLVQAVEQICDDVPAHLTDAISRLPHHPEYLHVPCPPPVSR